MIKIGIITMHRVQNYGSVLQAYALQRYIENLGYTCEIIDYQYPNKYHLKFLKKKTKKKSKSIIYIIERFIYLFLKYFIFGDTNSKLNSFRDKYLKLSDTYYYDSDSLKNNPPVYDLYITGSDQVWNPRFCCNDDIFMCSFVSTEFPKISYASSLAVEEIPSDFYIILKKYLSLYSSVGVREECSKKNLEKILSKSVSINCDPTLLISSNEWGKLASSATINIDRPYVLFYILDYSYDPYPQVYNLINRIISKSGVFPVFLKTNYKVIFKYKGKYISSISPSDFIYLIKNADFVVTSSFHGICYSLLMKKQFYALCESEDSQHDERIKSLLTEIGLFDRIIYKSKHYELKEMEPINYAHIYAKMDVLINNSKKYLSAAISDAVDKVKEV